MPLMSRYGRRDPPSPSGLGKLSSHEKQTIWSENLTPPTGGNRERMTTDSIAFPTPEGTDNSLVLWLAHVRQFVSDF
jgi:hypothetical protein